MIPKLKIYGNVEVVGSSERRILVGFNSGNGKRTWLCLPRATKVGSLFDALRNAGAPLAPTLSAEIKDALSKALEEASDAPFKLTDRAGWDGERFVMLQQVFGSQRDRRHFARYETPEQRPDQASYDRLSRLIKRYWRQYDLPIVALAAGFAGPVLELLQRRSGYHLHFVNEEQNDRNFLIRLALAPYGARALPFAQAGNLHVQLLDAQDQTVALEQLDATNPSNAEKYISDLALYLIRPATHFRPRMSTMERSRLVLLTSGPVPLAPAGSNQRHSSTRSFQITVPPSSAGGLFGRAGSEKSVAERRKLQELTEAALLEHQGWAIFKFLTEVTNDKVGSSAIALRAFNKFLTKRGPTQEPAERFRAECFATIAAAGELAIELDVLPLKKGRALKAAIVVYQMSERDRRNRAGVTLKSICERLQLLVEKGRFPSVSGLKAHPSVHSAMGVSDKSEEYYYVLVDKRREEEVFGEDTQFIKGALSDRGLLASKDEKSSYYYAHYSGYSPGPTKHSFLRIDYGRLVDIVKEG